MRPFDAIVFDLGSTLIYFDGDWHDVLREGRQAVLRSLRAAGLKLDDGVFLSLLEARLQSYFTQRDDDCIEYTTASILRALLAELGHTQVPDAVVSAALEAMYAVSQAHWHPEPDAEPTLRALQGQGYRLGMISNAGDDADVQRLVDRAGLRPFFEVILTSAAQGIRKPDPRIFHTALDILGAEPARAAMVGDSLEADILGAQRTGMSTIWITRRAAIPGNATQANPIQPDASISVLSELPDMLRSLPRRGQG